MLRNSRPPNELFGIHFPNMGAGEPLVWSRNEPGRVKDDMQN